MQSWMTMSLSRSATLMLLACATGFGATPQTQQAVVNQYCLGCHNSKLKSGGLAIDAVSDVSHNPAEWEEVVRKLRARMMPPIGLPRPDDKTYNSLLSSIEGTLDQAAHANPNPGRTDTFRRLNRTEYHNAIRDLLSVDVDV